LLFPVRRASQGHNVAKWAASDEDDISAVMCKVFNCDALQTLDALQAIESLEILQRRGLVELRGIEPLTSAVRLQRSPI
jgi:hypothetical protein